MTGWDRNESWDRDVLVRIGALLFALAGLADLAVGLPALRRRHVLGILSFGEAEARAFVIGISTGSPVPEDAWEEAGDTALLAASFRALALALCVMLAGATGFARPRMGGPRAGLRHAVKPAGRQAPSPAPDTS